MKHFTVMKKRLVFFLLIVFCFSCGGKVTTRTTPEEYKFTINGVVVKDMNIGKDIAYFSILRDGDPFEGAVVKVGTDTLDNQGNGNYYLEGIPLFDFGDNISINISSADDDFNLTTSVLMPGSFQITDINPTPVTSADREEVKLYGSASVGASGYFASIMRPDGSDGYTGLISLGEMIQGAKIPGSTFGEGEAFITGTYLVYTVAYAGSFLYYPGMEFYLPAGLPGGNISGANGTIGAGVVAPSAAIEAA